MKWAWGGKRSASEMHQEKPTTKKSPTSHSRTAGKEEKGKMPMASRGLHQKPGWVQKERIKVRIQGENIVEGPDTQGESQT